MCERFIDGSECEGEDGIAFRAQWGCDGVKGRGRKDDCQGSVKLQFNSKEVLARLM